MTLDFHSILIFLALNNFLIIILFIYQYFNSHKQWYLLIIALGISFQFFAIILFNYRDAFPPLLPLRINNFLLISSFALTSYGLLSFDGKLRKKLIWVFGVAVVLVYSWILLVEGEDTIISIVRISSSSFFFGLGAYYLFTDKNKYHFAKLISVVLFSYSVFQLIRALTIYQQGDSYDFFNSSAIDNWSIIISLFVISGSCIAFLMLLKEIDQKIIFENNKRIRQDKHTLEGLNLTQNKLFSIIAHDLRNPFSNILGLSSLLLEDNEDKTESKEYVGLINSTAKNTLNLLDNLLNWAHSQTGELNLAPKNFNLSDFISEIVVLNQSLAKSKNISLNSTPVNDIELFTDRNILGTILRNLISNAIKFTNQGGQINILASTKGQQVEISISDNGIGMSKEIASKIFDVSTTITSLGTEKESGSGLGLVICREFVEKLEGHLWVESEEGKGSDFKLTLPLNRNLKLSNPLVSVLD